MNKNTPQGTLLRIALISMTICSLLLIIVLPILYMFIQAFSGGIHSYLNAIFNQTTFSALKITLIATSISIFINLIFGFSIAWSIGKFAVPGKKIIVALIELPLSVSPVITGLTFILFLGKHSLVGGWLDRNDIDVVFAVPGIVICTLFVTIPYIAREIIPLMQEAGNEEEEAALLLGAGGLRTFFSITLPNIKWGVIYGILITNARAMGEFGAVSVISGNLQGKTQTLTLEVEALYNEYNISQSFAVASILALCALMTLIIKVWIEKKKPLQRL